MNCEVCPVDAVARKATKRVAFAPLPPGSIRLGRNQADARGDVFLTCEPCSTAAASVPTATITDITQEAPHG